VKKIDYEIVIQIYNEGKIILASDVLLILLWVLQKNTRQRTFENSCIGKLSNSEGVRLLGVFFSGVSIEFFSENSCAEKLLQPVCKEG
jgi:hypothetical protein